MKTLWKKALRLGAMGLFLGLLVGAGFLLLFGPVDSFLGVRGAWASAAYMLYCGFMGAVNNGGQVIYEVEEYSIARATVTHFLISMSTVTVLGYGLKWFPPFGPVFWIMTAACAAVYFAIWLAYYLAYRREVRRMNEDLKQWKSRRH